MWIILALGSALFAGLTSILAKVALKNVDSDLATALRTAVVLVFAWLMALVTGEASKIFEISTRSLVFIALSGIATGASWLCYYRALALGDVNRVTPIDKSSIILTMLLAFIFLGEELTWLKAVCMALIAAGTFLMVRRPGVQSEKKSNAWFVYAALSAVFASLTSILAKVGMEGVPSNLATALRTGVVLVFAWILVFCAGKQRAIRGIDRQAASALVLSGIATGLSWLCYYRALQEGPASVVVPIDKLSILVTTAFAALVLKEKISRRALLGLAAITAGTLLLVVASK
ncbi:MAG: EamA family transporter [Oscillospiraceae bacterium]